MIALPPGCSVTYAITVEVSELTNAMCDWHEQIGGSVRAMDHYDIRGRKVIVKSVMYNNYKWCHNRQDGTNGARLHFLGKDASVASMFLLKFSEYVQNHNLKEHMDMLNEQA